MSKFGRKLKQAPPGFEVVEPTLTALDNELREKVNEPHEGLRKTESQWPVHQINWQKSRYIYDLYYTYNRISREVYDYCITNKLVDAALIAKWKKPGYERLCSTYVINPRNYKFGTVSICRVPKSCLAAGTEIEDPMTGCRGCASGNGGERNIFGNKYGQYLAAIQVAREDKLAMRSNQQRNQEGDNDDEDSDDASTADGSDDDDNDAVSTDDYQGPVGAADGSSGKKASIWADEGESEVLEESMLGQLDTQAEKEGKAAAKHVGRPVLGGHKSAAGGSSYYGPGGTDNGDSELPGKRTRHA